ncbi:unnamed protein product, partial [Rotaria sp. Silwood1]
MAALAQNWQSLLNIRPTDIHVENEVEDEKNEQLGELYMKLNADELDNIDDLRHALRLGQRFTDFFREQKVEYWETLVKLAQENEKLKKTSFANAVEADTFLKDQISDLQRLLVLTENQADEYKKQYEHEFDELGQIRDKLKKSEVKVRELQNQRDDFRKRSEDLQKRVVELLGSSRVKPDDVERTQRIRAVEKELSNLLDENNNFFEENQHLRKDLTDLRREKEEVGAHIKKLSTGYKHNI